MSHRSSKPTRFGHDWRARFALSVLIVAGAVQACSNYFGSGPDPARDGRVDGGVSGAGNNGTGANGTGANGTGANGTGGSGTCDPLQAFGPNGEGANCASVLSCVQRSCDALFSSCFGKNYVNHNLNGGTCSPLISCVIGCGCGQGCVASCNPRADCANCIIAAQQCEQGACQAELSACSSGAGGSGGSGGSGATNLVPQISVNDLALDADTVYFTSNQGLAKVAKVGGTATPLGGFTQLNGLAVDDQSIYIVGNDGSLLAVSKDGSSTMTLGAATCGGGAGAVALAPPNVLFTTGPNLRNVPSTGGMLTDLAGDVSQGFGPASGTRLAVDAQNAYYIGTPMNGGSGALFGVPRLTLSGASCTGPIAQGTEITSAQSNLQALIVDGGRLFFSDLGSNGLSPVLTVEAIVSPSLTQLVGISLASLTASNNTSPNAGGALASDGTYLYFGGFDGIYRVLIGGPDCAALPCGAAELRVPGASASALAVDDSFIYYSTNNGPSGLMKIAK